MREYDYDFEYKSKRRKKHKVLKIIGRVVSILGSTLLLLIVFIFGLLLILLRGPSKEATKLFTLSCNETSAMKWVPTLLLTDEEYEAILNPVTEESVETAQEPSEEEYVILPVYNADGSDNGAVVNVGEVDESLPEIEVIDLIGGTYKGKLMIVRDPSKVQIASLDSFGGVGKTLSQFLEMYDAVGCTNAGGFEDENGKGKGGIPDGIVIKNGQITYGSAGSTYRGLVGFDADNVLHVGDMSGQQALSLGIVSATNFASGPVLIKDGVRQTGFVSGINPRTCIGQTADGTVLLVAIEGRMADSLGATFEDLADIMEKYGAVNACNLDGGSSSGMYYEGERITRSASVIGDRPLPTAVVVTR